MPSTVTVMKLKRPLWNSISTMKYCSSSALDVLRPGDILKQLRTFSMSDITEYSKLTHDSNPLHFDLELARNAGFTDVPVPGCSLLRCFLESLLPILSPVFVGDKIVGEVQASNIRQMKQKFLVKFMTRCFKCDDNVVISGEATAILPTLTVELVNNHD
ncbi:hypothetical protein DH2020_028147 [Rehmannia glutinosa]|uniref:MaoC-like domain-containing protein n=1 Tax=Rehmannia glutinosa TaxID=99300 RepID=A0ABR0VS91_REHGL